jgi:hypothetical protein
MVAVACWNIWIAKNEAIFEGKETSSTIVAIKSLSITHRQAIKHQKVRSLAFMSPVNIDYPVAFFDGAAQRDGKNIDDFRGEISPMGEIKGPLIFYWTNFLY